MLKISNGFEFITNQEIAFDTLEKEFVIPEGTLAIVVECEEDNEGVYKVNFEGYGNEETDWLRMEYDDIINCSKSAMSEY